MHLSRRIGLFLWAALAVLAVCCGGTQVIRAPRAPEYDAENKARCKAGQPSLKPLVVEWSTADRAELEALVHGAVVPVHYEGCQLEVLTSCKAPGTYAYTPVTPKDDHVHIKNVSDLYANIPVHAFAFEGKLKQSGELNVNMTIVGRFEASQTRMGVEDLEGNCATATHAVRAFIVGSFDFYAGARAEGSAGVKVLGHGGGASQTDESTSLVHDGTPGACQSSAASDHGPPFGCGALVRLELLPLGDAARVGESPTGKTAMRNPYDAKNLTTLTTACDQGHARSCSTLGEMYEGPIGVKLDPAKAFSLYKQACDAGDAEGCGLLGHAYLDGIGTATDVAKGTDVLRGACEKNCGAACYMLGDLYHDGKGVPADIKRYEALMTQAFSLVKTECDGGDAGYCAWLGGMYDAGIGVPKNEDRGHYYLKAACDAGLGSACGEYAELLPAGDETNALYLKGCESGDGKICRTAGVAFSHWAGGMFHGLELLKRACDLGIVDACNDLREHITHVVQMCQSDESHVSRPFHEEACDAIKRTPWLAEQVQKSQTALLDQLAGGDPARRQFVAAQMAAMNAPPPSQAAQADRTCRSGIATVCDQLALQLGTQDPAKAREYLELACRADSVHFVADCFKAAQSSLAAGDRGGAGDLAAMVCSSRNQSAATSFGPHSQGSLAAGCQLACSLGRQEACARAKLFADCRNSETCKQHSQCYPDHGMCCMGGMCGPAK